MKLSSESITLIVLSIILILVGSGVGGAVFFLIQNNSEIQAVQEEIALENLRADRYDALIAEFNTLAQGSDSEQFSIILPGEEEILEVIEEIELIAQAAGGELVKDLGETQITEEGLEVENEDQLRARGSSDISLKGDGFAILQITGTYRARFDGLVTFFDLLKQSKYFINVDSVNVSRVDIEEGPDTIDANIILNVYVDEILGL